MRTKTKKNLGTLLVGVGLLGGVWGIHELPKGNEENYSAKQLLKEDIESDSMKLVGASVLATMVGIGLLKSYNNDLVKEEKEGYFAEGEYAEGERDYIEYHDLS
jgi:hypothetical protein